GRGATNFKLGHYRRRLAGGLEPMHDGPVDDADWETGRALGNESPLSFAGGRAFALPCRSREPLRRMVPFGFFFVLVAADALVAGRELIVVAEGGGFEGAVARIGEHDPLAAPALAIVLEDLEALGLAAAIAVDEVAEIVAEVQEHAIVLGDVGPPGTFGGPP